MATKDFSAGEITRLVLDLNEEGGLCLYHDEIGKIVDRVIRFGPETDSCDVPTLLDIMGQEIMDDEWFENKWYVVFAVLAAMRHVSARRGRANAIARVAKEVRAALDERQEFEESRPGVAG